MTFVASGGLGDPPSTGRLRAFLALYPTLRFKLDARPDWTGGQFAELQELGCVDSIDLKGQYAGTVVDNPPDPGLYRRVLEAFPDAWIEDPALTDETIPLLEPHADRVTWDAPIHSIADIEALRWPPRTVNVKPSRFGSIERLFAAYDYCVERGIGAYGGGQWELSVGRGHIQLLAALFHPRHAERRRPGWLQRERAAAGAPREPARGRGARNRLPGSAVVAVRRGGRSERFRGSGSGNTTDRGSRPNTESIEKGRRYAHTADADGPRRSRRGGGLQRADDAKDVPAARRRRRARRVTALGRLTPAARAASATRIVVVGAGLAGLTCAHRLRQAGHAAEVYEASDRIGGRCWTLRGAFANGQIAEHGGELIDQGHNAIRNLARELGLRLDNLLAPRRAAPS